MPHARQIWVALLAIAFLSACAPSAPTRPEDQESELKNGQEVSEAAAQSTHKADIGALVLASSSMDAGRPEGEDDTQDAPADTPPAAPDAGLSQSDDTDASEDADTSGAPQ